MYKKKRQAWSFESLLGKAMKYCAYQERCIFELKQKLFEWGANEAISKKIVENILDEGFINEQRYTELFIKGKVNIKKWGKAKIRAALKQKHIQDELIDKQIADITDEDYMSNLKLIIEKKLKGLEQEESVINKKQKLFRYLISKGYEYDLVSSIIRDYKV